MDNKDLTLNVSEFLKKYFELLGQDVSYDVLDQDEVLSVNLKTGGELAGLLIGSKGKNIYSFQRLLNIIFNREGEGKAIVVNVDDWREKEENRLHDLARKTAEHVKQTGQPQNLYNLSASQRRIIHTFLSEMNDIKTESQGDGEQRFLTVSIK